MANPPEEINETILKMIKTLHAGTTRNSSQDFQSISRKRSWMPASSSQTSDDSSASEGGPTPVSRPRRNEDSFNFAEMSSPRYVRKLRADLISAQNLNKTYEGRIARLHGLCRHTQLTFDEEISSLKRQHENDVKSKEELEELLRQAKRREAKLNDDYYELKNSFDTFKAKSAEEVEELERTLQEYKDTTRQWESEENSSVPGLERRIAELESHLIDAHNENDAQRQLVEELTKQLTNQTSIKTELEMKDRELQNLKLQLKDFKFVHESYLEIQQQSKSQSQKLMHYSELLKENELLKEDTNRLKDQVRNKLILEEEVYDLKGRLAKFKEMEKRFVELQVQDTQNSLHLNEWRAVARSVCESTESDTALPHLLRNVVERLQQQELTLTSEKVQIESEVKNLSHENVMMKTELEKCQKLISELRTSAEQRKTLIHRLQKKLLLVTRERDSYRLQLDSYEKDLTVTFNPSTGNSNQGNIQKERIATLEKIIEEYRDYIAKLEGDIQDLQPGLNLDVVPARAEQISRLQNEISQLKSENERLRARKDELEIQLESYVIGDGQMVVHATVNPLQEMLTHRENMVERLEQEVNRLKRKIKNMEEGIEASKLGDITISSQELKALKEQIQNHEAQTQMLKEYFKSQMKEFRNVIYMLFGFKIDRTQNSLYKLRSMYAEQEDDLLCFQVDKEGQLTLLETDYTNTLESLINLHLNHQKSIPVFLCALTIDLFNSKTMAE